MSSNDREELVSIVDEEADRLNHLVSQAVEMARIEAREVQMHMQPLDMQDVATDAQQNCAWVAEKYSPPLTPIFVTAEMKGDSLAVSVADRGIGIDPSEQSLVFDRLYRSRTQTEGKQGTGMGLAIFRAIIEAHRGTLSVVSQMNRGSVSRSHCR